MTVRGLIDLLGAERALMLSRRFGGQRIYIPSAPPRPGTAAHAMGVDVWQALRADFRGERIRIPGYGALKRYVRRQRAVAMLNAGESVSAVARVTGLSDRTIRRIKC